MTTKPVKNVSASVRAKLLDLSRKNSEQFNFTLTRYALERLLYRLGKTNGDQFVLKGAMLFALWTTRARHRPTVDMDLLAYGPPSLDSIRSIFQTAAALAADDGMVFLPETVQTAEIAHTGERDQSDRSIVISRSEATLAGCIRDITRTASPCQVGAWKDL